MGPLIHIPLYCWQNAPTYAMHAMVQQHLVSLESYFAHENTYDLLVTTNDRRPLEILSAYRKKSGHRFELRFVTADELLSVFETDRARLNNISCTRTIFSKFYPILKQESEAIVHIDFDTMFLSRIDLTPLLVSDIALVDANQFRSEETRWCPTEAQIEFFRLEQPVNTTATWINSGVFSVQKRGFEICATEIARYLQNLERAIAAGIHRFTDEIIMNALAARESEAVKVIPDYRYNFLAYFLKHDPDWISNGQIVHFQSLKPDRFWYVDGTLTHRCDEVQAQRVSEDLYLAVLMWFRYLHAACRGLPYLFPLLKAIPLEVANTELARRLTNHNPLITADRSEVTA